MQASIAIAKNEVTISTMQDADNDDDDGGLIGAPQEIQVEVAPEDLAQTLSGSSLVFCLCLMMLRWCCQPTFSNSAHICVCGGFVF